MKVAFCVTGINERVLQRTEFYWQDYEILKSLGHEVTFLSNPLSLSRSYDLAFVWWWNYLWLWGPFAGLRGLPVMTTGVFDIGAFHRMPLPKRTLKKWGALQSDLNVVVSQDEHGKLPALLGGHHRPIRYSPLAIDSQIYTPATGRASSDSEITILNISWQREPNMRRKMVPELLEAFAVIAQERKDCRLILAGPPEDGGPILRDRARKLGIESRVEFPGEISRERKVSLLQSCTLYCQVSRYEGFGVAIGEAMACGAPVLVSPVGAVPEVVGDCGSYVRDQSVKGIQEGLRLCMGDLDGCRAKAESGVRRIRETFSVERRREDLRGFIHELV